MQGAEIKGKRSILEVCDWAEYRK